MLKTRSILLVLLVTLVPSWSEARVVRFVVEQTRPLADGMSFGSAGAYERLDGTAYFEVDSYFNCGRGGNNPLAAADVGDGFLIRLDRHDFLGTSYPPFTFAVTTYVKEAESSTVLIAATTSAR